VTIRPGDLQLIVVITDIADVQTVVDLIQTETDKLDGAATDGLSGVHDSLAFRVEEIEKHLHNSEQVFGNSSNAMLADEPVKFTVIGGDNAWGIELMLTDGTVIEGGSSVKKFDLNHLYVVSASAANKISVVNVLTSAINIGVACTFDFTGGAAEDIVEAVAHGLENGDKIVLEEGGGGALPAELNEHTVYYVVNKAYSYFQLSLTSGGGVFPFTDDGGGSLFWVPVNSAVQAAVQVSQTKKVLSFSAVNSDSHPFQMLMPRVTCDQRVFIRAKSETGSTISIGFLLGLHTYEA